MIRSWYEMCYEILERSPALLSSECRRARSFDHGTVEAFLTVTNHASSKQTTQVPM
jgi:hypothetical protein